MLDGQGCLLPVRHFLPEDSHFWPAQHSVCLAEASVEEKHITSADVPSNFAEPCPCPAAPMAESNFMHSERDSCRDSDLSDSVDGNSWLGKTGDLPGSFSHVDCKSTTANSSDGTSMKAVQPRSSDESSSKCSSEDESVDITHVARNGVVNEKEGLQGGEHGAKEVICIRKVNFAKSSSCKEKNAGVESCSTVEKGSLRPNKQKLVDGTSDAANLSVKPEETDEGCSSEAGNGQEFPNPSARQVDRLCCEGGNCKRTKTIISRVDACQDPSAGNAAEKELGCASNADSSEQQPYLPGLDDELALRCLACVPLCDLSQLSKLCRKHRDLVKSREIFQLRRMYGTVENLVFVYTSGPAGWTSYDANRDVWRSLPPSNVSSSFEGSDKESLSAGTHLLWFGKQFFECVYYRYDLLTNGWGKGPPMVNPRCLFASASCGGIAYVAGGFGSIDQPGNLRLLNSAEMYNSMTGEWEELPSMSTPRHKCAGVFMDGKFYVIGGRDANHEPITSAEVYDPSTRLWRTIPNMYFTPTILPRDTYEPSPPLVAAVNNQLYAVENTTNALKIYNKHSNTWHDIGHLPVSAYLRNGWGVAFKALGDRLFVMGDLNGIAACCWRPGAAVREPLWQLLSHRERGVDSFLFNCAVMSC